MTVPYACRFVADQRSVSLVEIVSSGSERTVRVVAGAGPAWEIVLPAWYLPSVAILGDTTAVWAATRLFFLASGKQAVRADFDDEIHAVFAVDGRFCVVGELSVSIYDAGRGAIVDRFQSGDVLGASWWEGGKLFVESAAGRPHIFSPSADAVGLTVAP
ncbi:MAG TPA: hypothetical protein VIG99_10190 [Myxococcaceae bacterium]|jgi:hypothetical protein